MLISTLVWKKNYNIAWLSHTIINMHPLAHKFDICALIFSICALFSVYPNHISCSGIPPLTTWYNHQSTGGRSERTQDQAKMVAWNSFSYICIPGLSTLSDISRIDAQPPPSFLCCPRPSHYLQVSRIIIKIYIFYSRGTSLNYK